MPTVAVIYDHLARPETTGVYCLRALSQVARVDQFHPSQLSEIPRSGYELYLLVDDGFDYPFPDDLRPQAYWAIDTHIEHSELVGKGSVGGYPPLSPCISGSAELDSTLTR